MATVSSQGNGNAQESSAREINQSSKLETVGRLASGVAHDFANIVTLISGYAEILIARGTPGRVELEEIRRAANRAAALTTQLLGFTRDHLEAPKPIDLNTVVTGVERMLRPIIGESIHLQLRLAPGLGVVVADPVQMDQVVMNLLLNARDAMPGGGTITVETRDDDVDASRAATLGMAAGRCVMLSIRDTGAGIDPGVLPLLFEPFFTTKPKGQGSGLGLSIVREIVRSCGGAVWAASGPVTGATFQICLPCLEKPKVMREINPAEHPDTRGDEVVLLVEDEEGVRRLLTHVLRMRGYNVLEAPDGEEALRLFREHGAAIRLVLTDVMMPRMTGPVLAEKLLTEQPDLKIVFMSGYPDDHLSRAGALSRGCSLLRKPLLPETVALAVREALDSSSRPFNPE